MQPDTRGGGRRSTARAATIAVVLLVIGISTLVAGLSGSSGPPQPVAAAPAPSASAPVEREPTVRTSATVRPSSRPQKQATGRKEPAARTPKFLSASAPTVLEIPSIGLRSSNFVDLEVDKSGALDVPGSADEVGLYKNGPTPGQLGPAVLGAHVDSKKGPGVFYNLGAVKAGEKIHITRRDKSRVTFVVTKVGVYPKDDFPTDEVYFGDFTRSEIRLVTCGGTFDRVKHYLDNVVVFGHLAP